MFSVFISSITDFPYVLSVTIGICQPSQERDFIFNLSKAIANSAEVTCSPVDKTVSYSEYGGISEIFFTKFIRKDLWLVLFRKN